MKILCCHAWLFLLVSVTAVAEQTECVKVLISADSDYAPLHWYDGNHLRGASIDIAVSALQAINVPYEVRYTGPFHRVLDAARSGEIDMVTSLKDSAERREYLRFVPVPLFSNPIAVFVGKERRFAYNGWADLIGKKGGLTRGNQFGNGFDEFIAKRLTVEEEQKAYMNFKKIELGRLDYLITGYYSGLLYLRQSGQADRFVALQPFVTSSDNLLAMSKRSPCMKYLPALENQLNNMRQKGQLKQILDKYVGGL
jgi:polar amino acid transport system substrate-binding protein